MHILLIAFGTAIGLAIVLFLAIGFSFLCVRFLADDDPQMAVFSGIISVSLVVISLVLFLYWVFLR